MERKRKGSSNEGQIKDTEEVPKNFKGSSNEVKFNINGMSMKYQMNAKSSPVNPKRRLKVDYMQTLGRLSAVSKQTHTQV